MSKSDSKQKTPQPRMIVFHKQRSTDKCTTETPTATSLHAQDRAGIYNSIAVLTNEVSSLKRKVDSYQSLFRKIFEVLGMTDNSLNSLQAYIQHKAFDSMLEDIYQSPSFNNSRLHLNLNSECTINHPKLTSRDHFQTLRNSLSMNSRRIDQIISKVQTMEKLDIAGRLSQVEQGFELQVSIIKLIEQRISKLGQQSKNREKQVGSPRKKRRTESSLLNHPRHR